MSRYRFRLKGKKDNGELIVEYRTRFITNLIDLQEYKHNLRQEFNNKGYKDISIDVQETNDKELFGI